MVTKKEDNLYSTLTLLTDERLIAQYIKDMVEKGRKLYQRKLDERLGQAEKQSGKL